MGKGRERGRNEEEGEENDVQMKGRCERCEMTRKKEEVRHCAISKVGGSWIGVKVDLVRV